LGITSVVSLDLAVLTPVNGRSFAQALAVCYEKEAGVPDDSGELEAYATEVYEAYGDDDWPFAGDPIVDDGFVLLTVAPDAWESQVPSLVERAHRRGLTALDPQWGGEGKLFPPAEPYV
jgi:hypothetical protein